MQHKGSKSWDELEKEMMGGMKLPDLQNIENVYQMLNASGRAEQYPLLVQTYLIAFKGADPKSILEPLRSCPVNLQTDQ